MSINIGINETQRQTIAQGLSKVLADTYTLYLKTHNYHWNVEGPMFHSLHTMFEEQYNEASKHRVPTANSPNSLLSPTAKAATMPLL